MTRHAKTSPGGTAGRHHGDWSVARRAHEAGITQVCSLAPTLRQRQVKELFSSLGVECNILELDQIDDGASVQEVLSEITSQRTVPNIFVNKVHMGGCDRTFQEAAILGKKVMVLDFVVPSPQGTSWGLGGTCVNVGCIPKKLMHQAALLGQALVDSRKFGWEYNQQVKHNWETMTEAIQNHIGSLNWGYRLSLREKAVAYVNSYGEFVEHHKIKATNRKGQETCYTAAKFVIATGERPRYLGIQGDKEYCITSDDLFSLPYCPGKTLVVGASYVALECAGFLAGVGLDVTVMVRSILLRGFDQEMAEKVGSYMEQHGVKFLRKFVPVMVQQLEKGSPGKLKVVAKSTEGPETIEGVYNTVLLAIGRDSCTKKIGLEKIGVKINEKSGKVPVNDVEQTNVPYVYAIGDVLEGKLELTPVAIQAGKLLARRLFGGRLEKCDYINVPTTVFTPLEYGCCGLSEEKAIEVYKKENLEVYHTLFWPLEWTVAGRDNNTCYAKIICNKFDNDRVIGFHILGPNAGEVTQGFAAAMKCGLTKQLLDDTIGIHPTCGVHNVGNHKVLGTGHHAGRLLRLVPLLLAFLVLFPFLSSRLRGGESVLMAPALWCRHSAGLSLTEGDQPVDEETGQQRASAQQAPDWQRQLHCFLDVVARNPITRGAKTDALPSQN
ncbi:thioredoxin reductase 3 isoform X2 [Diceros bicornis minor]|uniref:thioredoxin reductase 3 isoform X2 n=1 Tax=Diceros bicornis minor TaxID=77932 RepID=UPI0026EF67FE|nr:thioredoxin reductase 3 isoform X2 [Diceros bicornis minor]